jgi:hypothetical protein
MFKECAAVRGCRREVEMRAAIVAIVLQMLCCATASAQQPFSCSDFERHEDGAWTPRRKITIGGPGGAVEFGPETALRAGAVQKGVDLGGLLDVMCGFAEPGRAQ